MKENQIQIHFQYDKKLDRVNVFITPLSMFSIPYEIFKNGYYSVNELRKKKDLIVPDNRIVVPSNHG